MKTSSMKFLLIIFASGLFVSCGGGGSSTTTQTQKSVVSGHVPYLLSAPSVTFKQNTYSPADYDVTVEIEADGPTGVMFAHLWILDSNNTSNFESIELYNIPGTQRWTASAYSPLSKGNYYI